MVSGLVFFEEIAREGEVTHPAALKLPDFAAAPPITWYERSGESALRAWSEPGRLEAECQLPFGQMRGADALGIHAADVLIHGWDIATAVGVDASIDEDLALFALDVERRLITPEMRGSAFGPERGAAPDSSAAARLLAWVGRTP